MSPSAADSSSKIFRFPSSDVLNSNLTSESLRSFGCGAIFGTFSGYSLGWWSNALPKARWQHAWKMAGKTGTLSAIAYATIGLTAHSREVDDFWNYGAGGAAAGAFLGLLQKSFARSLLHAGGLGTLCLTAAYMHVQNGRFFHSDSSAQKQHDDLYKDFLQGSPKDPFQKRWEQIQARKENASA